MQQFNLPLFPEQASTVAKHVDALYLFLVAITAFFSLLIAALILFFIIKYKRTPGREAEQIHGSTLLEATGTGNPLGLAMTYLLRARSRSEAGTLRGMADQRESGRITGVAGRKAFPAARMHHLPPR